ncbi:MAG: pilin [Minisyncoccia bacterium]
MKKFTFFFFIFLFTSFTLAWATPPATMPEIPEVNVNIWDILDRALSWFFGIALIIASIMLVYAGFTYVTASGNNEKVQTATKTLIYALIGVAIALLAKGLPMLVQDFLQGNNSNSTTYNSTSDNNTTSDILSSTDFSTITGGNVPNSNCPPGDLSCTCKYDPNASGDQSPCGYVVGGGGGPAKTLL